MPIGRFARACRLSVKALRHYDDEQLLRPAHVDERTGYRYYPPEQVRDAVTIPVPNLPQARIVEVPGGEFATVTHVGPYEQLGLAYHALYAWAQEHGHEPRGLIREIYVNDPANVPPAALQTELLLPL
jgi:effector-binding domain-containing protein